MQDTGEGNPEGGSGKKPDTQSNQRRQNAARWISWQLQIFGTLNRGLVPIPGAVSGWVQVPG